MSLSIDNKPKVNSNPQVAPKSTEGAEKSPASKVLDKSSDDASKDKVEAKRADNDSRLKGKANEVLPNQSEPQLGKLDDELAKGKSPHKHGHGAKPDSDDDDQDNIIDFSSNKV